MSRWLRRRIASSLPVLFGITVLMFAMLRLTPGDPIAYMTDPSATRGASAEYVSNLRAQLGLDQPLPIQYLAWLRELAHGNLGYSYDNGLPVGELILQRVEPTVRLMGTGLLLALLIGIPLGVVAALRQYSILDYVIAVLSLTAVSTPLFFLGLAGIYVFSLQLHLVPLAGMIPVGSPPTFFSQLHHLLLPATILALSLTGPITRYTRASMLEATHQDYVVTARAKGLSERRIAWVHVLRNAMIPIVSVVGVLIPVLFSGSVIVEQIFSWPGMGQLVLLSISQRNYPVLMGITLAVSVIVLVTSMLTDLAYAIADPRIRIG